MSSRTLVILIVSALVAATTFVIARALGFTFLFVPLFLFWSWGERPRDELKDDDSDEVDEVLPSVRPPDHGGLVRLPVGAHAEASCWPAGDDRDGGADRQAA